MSVRKLFVDPGDFVVVHVMGATDLPKNEKEWSFSGPRPHKFSFTAEPRGVTFHDPGTDIFMQQGSSAPRYHMAPHNELAVNREVALSDVLSWADGVMGALGTEHAGKVTDEEARIAWAITNAPK